MGTFTKTYNLTPHTLKVVNGVSQTDEYYTQFGWGIMTGSYNSTDGIQRHARLLGAPIDLSKDYISKENITDIKIKLKLINNNYQIIKDYTKTVYIQFQLVAQDETSFNSQFQARPASSSWPKWPIISNDNDNSITISLRNLFDANIQKYTSWLNKITSKSTFVIGFDSYNNTSDSKYANSQLFITSADLIIEGIAANKVSLHMKKEIQTELVDLDTTSLELLNNSYKIGFDYDENDKNNEYVKLYIRTNSGRTITTPNWHKPDITTNLNFLITFDFYEYVQQEENKTLTLFCETYNNENQIIGIDSFSFTVTVPVRFNPSALTVTITPESPIYQKSTQVTFTATINYDNVSSEELSSLGGVYKLFLYNDSNYRTLLETFSLNGNQLITTIDYSGMIYYKIVCTNSVNKTIENTGNFNVSAYEPAIINIFNAFRKTRLRDENDDTADNSLIYFFTYTFSGVASEIPEGDDRTITVTLNYNIPDVESNSIVLFSGKELRLSDVKTGTIDLLSSEDEDAQSTEIQAIPWYVTLTINDGIGEVSRTITLSPIPPVIDIVHYDDKDGIAFGQIAENTDVNRITTAWPIYFTGNSLWQTRKNLKIDNTNRLYFSRNDSQISNTDEAANIIFSGGTNYGLLSCTVHDTNNSSNYRSLQLASPAYNNQLKDSFRIIQGVFNGDTLNLNAYNILHTGWVDFTCGDTTIYGGGTANHISYNKTFKSIPIVICQFASGDTDLFPLTITSNGNTSFEVTTKSGSTTTNYHIYWFALQA